MHVQVEAGLSCCGSSQETFRDRDAYAIHLYDGFYVILLRHPRIKSETLSQHYQRRDDNSHREVGMPCSALPGQNNLGCRIHRVREREIMQR